MPTIFKVHYRLYYGRLRLQLLRPFYWICRITWSSLTYPHLDIGASNEVRTRASTLARSCTTTILYLHMVAPGGIEPTVSALKGQRTSPLFEGAI